MRLEGFGAVADVVGRRVRVGWDVVLDDGESPAAVPALRLRRKERDFEVPVPADPFLVYDAPGFPPAGTTVTEVDLGGELLPDGGRVTAVAESAAADVDGRSVEVLRRTRTTTVAPDGQVVRRHEEVLDVGGGAGL